MNTHYLDPWTAEEYYKLHLSSYFSKTKLAYKKLEGGIIFPPPLENSKLSSPKGLGGVGNAEGEFIDGTFLQSGEGGIYPYDNCATEDVTAIYVGFFYGVWGHIITDNLKFLWFLYSDTFKKLQAKHKNLKLVYISPSHFNPQRFSELISMADIDFKTFERVDKVTRYKELIVPDSCFFLNGFYRYYTIEYQEIIAKIMSKVNTINIDKVYLTRVKLHDKRDFGEKEVETAFRKKGYKIIAPEKITLKEQLSVYKSAKELVTTEGSISHNAVFMTEGTSLILLKKTNLFNTYQETINDMKHLHVTYIDAHLSCFVDVKAPWFGPFFMYCNNHISDFLGCKKKFNTFKYMIYIFKCFRQRNIERRMLSNEGLYHKMGIEFNEFLSPKQRIIKAIKSFRSFWV